MAIVLPKFSRRRSPSGLAIETQPALNVALCREDGNYPAGGVLRATYRVSRVPVDHLDRMEVSVLWYTDGKGDEDLQVQFFQSIDRADLLTVDPTKPQMLECQLPATPLSYHGRLVSVCWCLRVRLFMVDGKEIVTEQPFHLVAASQRFDFHLVDGLVDQPPSSLKTTIADRSVESPDGETVAESAESGPAITATQSDDLPEPSSNHQLASSHVRETAAATILPNHTSEDSNRKILLGRFTGSLSWRRLIRRS